MSTIISDMEIRLRADIARLQSDMDAARRTVGSAMDNIGAKVKSAMSMFAGLAAGMSVFAMGSFIKGTLDVVDSLTDLSTRTAISVEDLAGLSYGAKLSGTELEAAAASISKLSVNMGKDADRYAKLGITAQEPLEAFKQFADIFKSIQDPQARAAFGAEALGKSWQEAAVLLNEGSSGISDLVARGLELSGITTQNSADAAAFNDALDELGAVAQGVGVKIAVDFLPVLKILTDEALNSSKAADAADTSFKPLTETFKAIVVFGGNVLYVLKTIGQEIGGIAAQIVVAYGAVANLLKLDFKAAARDFNIAFGKGGMGDKMKEDAEKSRQAIDQWSESVINAGKEAKEGLDAVEFPDPFGIDGKIAEENAARADAFVKYAEQQATSKKLADVAAAAAKKEQEAYRNLLTTLAERIAAGKAELAAGRELTEAEKATIKLDSELASGKTKLSAGHLAHVRTLMAEADAMDKSAASAKKVREAIQALTDEQNAAYVSLAAEVKGNEDAVANFGLTKESIELVTIARLEDRLARRGELDMSEAYVAQLTREIDLRKQNATALGGLEALAAQKKVAEDNLAEQTKMWESVDQRAHDTFVSIFDSGKSTLDRLRDTLKNGLLDLLYQMTIKKWILNIGAAVSGGGAAGLATADGMGLTGGAVGGGLGGVASLAQSAKTAYTIATQGFSGVAAGIGGSIATLGNLFGSSAVSAFGAGMGMTGAQAAAASAAYGSAGMAGTGTALTSGAFAGAAVTAAAGIAAGVLGGKLISGQYGSNATVIGGTGIGAVAGAFMGGPIGAAIGGALGGLIGGIGNRLFGMGDKKYGETGITGTLSGTGFTGNEYAKWTQKGGVFRSDKSGTDRKAVDATTSNAFVETYAAIRNVSATLANTLGVDTSSLATRAQALNINLTGLTTEADRLGAVTKFFEGVGNAIAVELLPNVGQFKQGNEELSATLQRVAGNYAGVDAALQLIGRTSQDAFGAVGVATIGARENLIKLAGSLDSLTSGTSFFSENFLTEAEQMAPVLSTVADTLGKLGMAGTTTMDDYKKKVLGLNLASAADQELYIKLLALAPAFKAASDYSSQLAAATGNYAAVVKTASEIASERMDLQKQLNELTKSETELLAIQRSSIAAVNRALFDQVQAAKAVVSAKDALGKAYDREAAAAQTAVDKSKSWLANLNGMNDSMTLGSQSVLTPEQKYAEARAQFEKTLAAANAGDTTAQSGLSAAEQAFLTASQVVNASDAKYAADYARVIAANQDAAKWAAAQVDVQQASLDALKAQVSGLITINDSVLTVAQAIANLHAAMGTASGLGVQFDGSHAGGLANVPFDGYAAELHRGEVVVDAPAAAAMRRYFGGAPSQGGGNNDALVAEIKSLREEVKGLRADQHKQTGAAIQATVESNASAAKTVVAGVDKSAKGSAWASTVKGEYA
ncbi:hypothetical protein SAMN05216517_106110 [Janthinobacterium sp. OK676]|uniref:hypothetical protein n=1 Tax=Janthinobacterium sp. OK676 TaxID=1855295 RepID=UPI0008922A8A|nr:hypothetical protein [Janthinobacterium sp. OK676]SDM77502.1 hypothetical protein SAMN05216517_106110 [Janthinobacterium sp. OK676]